MMTKTEIGVMQLSQEIPKIAANHQKLGRDEERSITGRQAGSKFEFLEADLYTELECFYCSVLSTARTGGIVKWVQDSSRND